MTAYKLSFKNVVLLLLLLAANGCKKFVQVTPPDTQLQAGIIFASDQTATAAMMGVYSQAMVSKGYFLNGGNSICPGLSADEFTGTSGFAMEDAFSANALFSTNSFIVTLYSTAYTTIYNTNSMMENLQASHALSEKTSRQLRGESMCLRALTYFHLTDLWGPAPLETSTDYSINAVAPRSPDTAIYRQVTNDLLAADSLLDTVYATGAGNANDRTRPNKWAARALLARVWLYRGQWAAAEEAATAVLQSGMYQLEPLLDSVFRTGSQEAIWQLQPVSFSMNSAEGAFFVPADGASTKPLYTLTTYLLKAFEPGDQRRLHWVGTKTINGVSYAYPYKYKVRTGIYPYLEYNMVLRLAEIYLIRAEARAQQNNLSGAITDLDSVRSRAGLPDLSPALSSVEILAAVMQERRIELMAEWGHRWSDLRRTGQATAVLGPQKPNWTGDASLYPIPQTELLRNSAIMQNPGY